MTKLKNVEEVANRLEPIFTQSDAYEFDNGYTSLIPAIELAKQVITQDRQAIHEALRERLEDYIPPFSADRENPLKHCYQNEGYAKGIEDALALVDELLGGEVTE